VNALDDAAVVVCGDVTSKGDLAGYEEGLAYLKAILDDSKPMRPARTVHLVPGNHDVDYYGSMPYVNDSVDRFSELEGRVSKSGLTFPVTTDVRITTHGLPNNQVQIISVNTCRACGAIRPSAANADYDRAVAHELGITLDQYHDARKKAAASTADPREVLDIPMLHPEDYTKLVTASQDAARKGVPTVVVAHHPFLPQALNRISPYTEMINGGQVREGLLRIDHPLIYLHGHIHRDSIELLRGGGDGAWGGPVLSVAAPTLSQGYNQLDLCFDGLGRMLGVEVTRFRVSLDDGQVRTLPSQRIPMAVKRTAPTKALREAQGFLYSRTVALGSEIIAHVNKKSARVSERELETFLSGQIWLDRVEVTQASAGMAFGDREYRST